VANAILITNKVENMRIGFTTDVRDFSSGVLKDFKYYTSSRNWASLNHVKHVIIASDKLPTMLNVQSSNAGFSIIDVHVKSTHNGADFRVEFIVFIFFSTHSDFVVRELSYLISFGHLGVRAAEVRRKFGYSDGDFLRSQDVSVYSMSKGSAVPIPTSSDGFSSPAIEDEIDKMNALAFALLELKDG